MDGYASRIGMQKADIPPKAGKIITGVVLWQKNPLILTGFSTA